MTESMDQFESNQWDMLESLYFEGLEMDPSGRRALLELQDVEDGLREELVALWETEPSHDAFLDSLPYVARSYWDGSSDMPEQVGDYRLMEILGQGGMGVVYRARQISVDREVAVKMLPPWLSHNDAFQQIFQREQRILGQLQHPNIAVIHDAGFFDDRPYLVMELLEGVSLTKHAEDGRLGLAARLDLFLALCAGMRYAHRKPLIHRDLKPSNVLVVDTADGPALKIIDFGIAEPVENTAAQGAAGTPEYMSPERLKDGYSAASVADDVYAAGVVLFELLAGVRPFAMESTELDVLLDARKTVPSLGMHLSSNPKRFEKRLPRSGKISELGWILKRALHFEPESRYQSMGDLAEDVRRFRENQPILAAPDQVWYPRLKWIFNHRGLVMVLLAIPLFLGLHLNRMNQSIKRRQAVHEFFQEVLGEGSIYRHGPGISVGELLDLAARRLPTETDRVSRGDLHYLLGVLFREQGRYVEAETHLKPAYELYEEALGATHTNTLEAMEHMAYIYYMRGEYQRAYSLFERGLILVSQVQGATHPQTAIMESGLAMTLSKLGRYEEADTRFQHAMKILRSGDTKLSNAFLGTLNNYADQLLSWGKPEQAGEILSEALGFYARQHPEPDPFTLTLQHNFALSLHRQKRYEAAIELGEQTLQGRIEQLGARHDETLNTLNNLVAATSRYQGPEAAVALLKNQFGGVPEAVDNRMMLTLRNTLGDNLNNAGRHSEAVPILKETWEKRVAVFGYDASAILLYLTLSESFQGLNLHDEAERVLLEAVALATQHLGPDHRTTQLSQRMLDGFQAER